MPESDRLVWIDLEMTGLDLKTCTIIEIATIVTDGDLEVIAEGPSLAIHQPLEVLEAMDDWNVHHHRASGLWERVLESKVTMAEAEARTVEFLKLFVEEKDAPLCGNSVWQDRRFLIKYMPQVNDHLHHRLIDVSSIKELVYRWYPPAFYPPPKQKTHLALNDIRESIEELRFYREHVFVQHGPRL